MTPPTGPLRRVLRELDIFLGFSWRDLTVTLIPGSIFAFGALRSSHQSLAANVSNLLFLTLWLTLFIYFFALSNQITGVDEDRVNKPGRPIPSGKVTMEGAKFRWALALLGFLLLGACRHTLLAETVTWVLTTAFLSLTPGGSHWLGKNFVALIPGTWSLLSASWKAISPKTPEIDRYIFALAVWAGLIAQIADLRDVKGDKVVGRRTLPLVFGDSMSRHIIVWTFLPSCLATLWLGDLLALAPFTLLAVHLILGYRVIQGGGPRYDHNTYMACLLFILHHQSLTLVSDGHLYLLLDARINSWSRVGN